jgi:hypothetical protein
LIVLNELVLAARAVSEPRKFLSGVVGGVVTPQKRAHDVACTKQRRRVRLIELPFHRRRDGNACKRSESGARQTTQAERVYELVRQFGDGLETVHARKQRHQHLEGGGLKPAVEHELRKRAEHVPRAVVAGLQFALRSRQRLEGHVGDGRSDLRVAAGGRRSAQFCSRNLLPD